MPIEDDIKQKILSETATIDWKSLERFYASGSVIWVDGHLDLVDIALKFIKDDNQSIEKLLISGEIAKLNKKIAKDWQQTNPELWATVVSPWVLVQLRLPS